MSKVRKIVKRQRHVKTFAELSQANWVLLEKAKVQREGRFYECMAAILISAFRFEAYLNHIGNKLFPFWGEMEQLPFKNKLNIIRKKLSIKMTDGERPYQTLKNLFKFRNDVAHGKSEFLDPPESDETGSIEELRQKKPLTQWEKLCTIEFAKRAYEDTEKIMKDIHKNAGFDSKDLNRSGHSYSMKDMPQCDHRSLSKNA